MVSIAYRSAYGMSFDACNHFKLEVAHEQTVPS